MAEKQEPGWECKTSRSRDFPAPVLRLGGMSMKITTRLAGMLAGLLLLVPLSAWSPSSGKPALEATPTEEAVEYATEAQVASVIAKYETDWRKVIEESGQCRLYWVEEDPSDEASLKGYSCFMREKTLGMTAQLAADDLDAKEVPPSMKDLVSETTMTLLVLASVNLEEVCGAGDASDLASEECSSALGLLNTGYSHLEQSLNAWSPYL